MKCNCKTLYGTYDTGKFTDFFPDVNKFLTDYSSSGIPTTITEQSATTLYYLLYARYGNSHIANSDPNQFRYKLWSTIFQYGPTWEKRLELQNKLRNLTDDEIRLGTQQINNHAFNPSTEPSTSTLEELTAINEQSSLKYKKGKLDAYAWLFDVLKTDVTEQFLIQFKKLFLLVVEPQHSLYYEDDD